MQRIKMQTKSRIEESYMTIQRWQNRKSKTRSLQNQLRSKNSEFRYILSILLKLWRFHRSLITISNLYDINCKILSKKPSLF